MVVKQYKVNTSKSIRIKIAILADIHGKCNKKTLKYMSQFNPDIIAIPGDLVDQKHLLSNKLLDFLVECIHIAPTFFSFGNHDVWLTPLDIDTMKRIGVHILDNEWLQIEEDLYIGGITSTSVLRHKCLDNNRFQSTTIVDVSWIERIKQKESFKIILDHHPENYAIYTRNMDVDIVISGHTHGGQISVFGLWPSKLAKQNGWFKYRGGIYDNKLIVSRGITNTMMIPRIGNPTELVIVDIRKQKDEGGLFL